MLVGIAQRAAAENRPTAEMVQDAADEQEKEEFLYARLHPESLQHATIMSYDANNAHVVFTTCIAATSMWTRKFCEQN